MQKAFQQNSGMLRQTELVIFSQTASLLLMNAAGRVSVSPAEITVNTGNMCPLRAGATQQARQKDRQTYIKRRGTLNIRCFESIGTEINTSVIVLSFKTGKSNFSYMFIYLF